MRLTLKLAIAVLLAACAGSGEWLNSDRIERAFGSYGVEVLYASDSERIASLFSDDNGVRTTRTYALTRFVDRSRAPFADVHARITAGESIGATFRDAGWAVDKQHLFIGELEIPPAYEDIGSLMRISLPATLATHHYLLTVSRDGRSWNYATITEIHHPDYLTAPRLREIYGEILLDDSGRDQLADFIGPADRHRGER